MAVYEFKIEKTEEVVEVFMSFSEHERRVKDDWILLDDGRPARKHWSGKSVISTVPSNFPQISSAAGVNPNQIKEHMDHLRSKGCGQVNHTSDGDIIFESKGQRRQVLQALGMYDRNGGYSDPAPNTRTSCRKFR